MIVTLAGHVDHGKTSLVRALTGTDTDRLAEEQRRGLTIDLGFAYLDTPAGMIGFVDVPGHHRFIHNMVAGVAEQQFALLAIAADDGPMPQSREHLQILRLLGLSRGVIALTKCDRVEDYRRAWPHFERLKSQEAA
jgi:selenocysteine-specific elongation factor